jgi:hypothetical protein
VSGLLGNRVGGIGMQFGRSVNAPIRFFDDRRQRFTVIFVCAKKTDDFPGRYARDAR